MKLTLIVALVAIISFFSGYYTSYITLYTKVDELDEVSDLIQGQIQQFNTESSAQNISEDIRVERIALESLIAIHENGTPIDIAIRDHVLRIKNSIQIFSALVEGDPDIEDKDKYVNMIEDTDEFLKDFSFFYGEE